MEMILVFIVLPLTVAAPFLAIAFAIYRLIQGEEGRDIRKKDGLLKRIGLEAIDFASPVGNPRANMETVFAFGKKQPLRTGNVTVFQATKGWRYGYIAVVAFLIYLCTQTEVGPLFYYVIGGGTLLWCGIYMWRFRLEIDGSRMICTTPTLRTKEFDLALLDSVRETQDGYKLRFADGRKVTVPQFLEGHGFFKKMMIQTLEINGR